MFNDPYGLDDTLKSLLNQEYPKEYFEVIIVDNGSTDNTFQLATKYAGNYPNIFKCLVENSIKSSYAARNRGINKAVGSLISFIDSNVIMETDFIFRVVNYFESNPVDYLGNRVELTIIKDTLSARYNKMNDFKIESNIRYSHYSPTCCLTVRSSVIDKVGVFDNRFESGGDWDFGQRTFQAKLNQDYAKDIVVYHPARSSYIALINKGRRIARGVSQLSYYRPKEYNKLFRRYFSIRRYFPENPFGLFDKYKSIYDDTTKFQAIIYAFFHIPIRIISIIELVKEKIKLIVSQR